MQTNRSLRKLGNLTAPLPQLEYWGWSNWGRGIWSGCVGSQAKLGKHGWLTVVALHAVSPQVSSAYSFFRKIVCTLGTPASITRCNHRVWERDDWRAIKLKSLTLYDQGSIPRGAWRRKVTSLSKSIINRSPFTPWTLAVAVGTKGRTGGALGSRRCTSSSRYRGRSRRSRCSGRNGT